MPELPELFMAHYDEIALDKSVIKLDPDWNKYCQLELHGILHVMTVRDTAKLVGYHMSVVSTHLHYKSTITALSDIFYLLPEYRQGWTGYKLFEETEKMLKVLGVKKFYNVTKAHLPINIIMKRRGYRLVDKVYTKLL